MTRLRTPLAVVLLALLGAAAFQQHPHALRLFRTADACMGCHNGIPTSSGEDLSFGADWRASMMANAARDPYWQAAVRREVTDHPSARAAIEDECSKCHMPMARYEAHANGGRGEIFANLPVAATAAHAQRLAADGVSCTVCHQITDAGLGTRESFVGGFVIDAQRPAGERLVFGPLAVDGGRAALMRSASDFRPAESAHVQRAELCATCHTLYTHTLGPDGETVGELPEQVPYLEWRHSAYREEKSCQSCHMPVVEDSTAVTGVLGRPHAGVSRHAFRGGNVFMLRMLNRYRAELGVAALPQDLDAAAGRTLHNLQTRTARLSVDAPGVDGGRLIADVHVENLAGHKLPTAYPSRRAWVHLTVHDGHGTPLFESGAVEPSGAIAGNDNDADPARYEPHYAVINRADQVQIYETILADPDGRLTTGLLTALRYVKDNRLLPGGFDKATAEADVAVHGAAAGDADFTGGSDRVRYVIDISGAEGPFRVEAVLRYQTIAYRWARNLDVYAAPEPERFVRYYDAMSQASTVVLASSTAEVR